MTRRRVVLKTAQGEDILGTTLMVPVVDQTLLRHWSSQIAESFNREDFKSFIKARDFVGLRYCSLVLYGSINWQSWIENSIIGQTPELNLHLYTRTKVVERTNVAERFWLGGSSETPPHAKPYPPGTLATNYVLPMYGSKWTLAVSTTPLFAARSTSNRRWFALVGGTLLTLSMAAALAVQIRAKLRHQTIANELRLALNSLESSREERARLSRDLHDGAIQSLYALQLGFGRTIEQAESASPKISRRLDEYRNILTSIIGELRRYILRHERENSPGADFGRVLSALIKGLQPSTSVKFELEIDPVAAKQLTDEQAVQFANIAREAFSNSLRHANPHRIEVGLASEETSLVLSIRDDGCGFDSNSSTHGMGLKNMSIRANEAGGEFLLNSQRGVGTEILIRLAKKPGCNSCSGREGAP